MQNLPHAIKGITLIPNTTVNCAIPIQTGFSKSHQKLIITVEPHLTDTSLLQTHSSGSNSVQSRGAQLYRAILLLPWTHASCPFWILLCSFGEKSETKSRTESLGLRLHNQAFDSFHYVDMEGRIPQTSPISHTGITQILVALKGLRAYALCHCIPDHHCTVWKWNHHNTVSTKLPKNTKWLHTNVPKQCGEKKSRKDDEWLWWRVHYWNLDFWYCRICR